MNKRVNKGVTIVIAIAILTYLSFDFIGPETIELKDGHAFGLKCKKAKDLSIQMIDESGNAWASRGMIVYCKKKNETTFRKIVHVPTGFSLYWLRNFSAFRWITRRPECIEFTVSKEGDISVLSAGKMWYFDSKKKTFIKTLKLHHYGKGNQGIFNNGILQTREGRLFFGEYFKNEKDTSVSIYESVDFGKSWHVKYKFSSHTIRHIHSIHQDPFSKSLWLTTGDEEGNYIYRSDDYFTSIQPIGFGEKYFTTQLLFTKEDVYWGSDTESDEYSGIYRWNRKNQQLSKVLSFPSIFFYSNVLKKGTMIFSTTRESLNLEKDEFVRLFIRNTDGKWNTLKGGQWRKNPLPFLFQRAKTRFPRENNDSDELFMSVLKQKGFSENELIIITENELINKFK